MSKWALGGVRVFTRFYLRLMGGVSGTLLPTPILPQPRHHYPALSLGGLFWTFHENGVMWHVALAPDFFHAACFHLASVWSPVSALQSFLWPNHSLLCAHATCASVHPGGTFGSFHPLAAEWCCSERLCTSFWADVCVHFSGAFPGVGLLDQAVRGSCRMFSTAITISQFISRMTGLSLRVTLVPVADCIGACLMAPGRGSGQAAQTQRG